MADARPSIAVLPDKRWNGINNLNDEVLPLKVGSWQTAFEQPWESDAHFVCYSPAPVEGDYPRCNKPVLSKIREAGADLVMNVLAFDYDNPGHQRWTAPGLNDFLEKLAEIAADWPIAEKFTLLYTTKHGARLVFALKNPVPVDAAEGHHRWIVQEFKRRGLEFDPRCSDWTRVFRLPWVVRDGVKTWEDNEDVSQYIEQPDATIDALELPTAGSDGARVYAPIEDINDPQPDPDDSMRLLWIDPQRSKMTEWMKAAKHRLKGRKCYDCIFNHSPLAVSGSRNTTIFEYVGQMCGLLCGPLEGTTPAHLYALLLPAVEQLEADDQTPDWTTVLWDHVRRLYAMQTAKVVAERQAVEEEQRQEQEVVEDVARGFRQWCDSPHMSVEDPSGFISQHLICSVGSTYFVCGKNGYFMSVPLQSQQVIPFIKRQRMQDLIEVEYTAENGMVLPYPLNVVLAKHGTIVNDIKVTSQDAPGGSIDGIDGPDATICLPAFGLNHKLSPTWDREVDEWLRHFWGEHYDLGCKWIAKALKFGQGAIAALSIRANQGIGKKLLTQGLAECLRVPVMATHDDLVSDYQYGLLKSPFLLINEGFPTIRKGTTPYHTFRGLVSGDPRPANRKNLHPVDIRCPYRVMFTANNDNIIETLVGNGQLSPEDREALAIRLIHLNLTDKAMLWLRSKGGLKFTGRQGRRWIAGDGGEKSDYVVAQHFLWLYYNDREPNGSRLLVEGDTSADVMFRLRTESGGASLVIETIVKMLNAPAGHPSVAIEGTTLYVLSHGVCEYFRQNVRKNVTENLTLQQCTSALKGLMLKEHTEPVELATRKNLGRRRWIELDTVAMLSMLDRIGLPCKPLEELVTRKRAAEGHISA